MLQPFAYLSKEFADDFLFFAAVLCIMCSFLCLWCVFLNFPSQVELSTSGLCSWRREHSGCMCLTTHSSKCFCFTCLLHSMVQTAGFCQRALKVHCVKVVAFVWNSRTSYIAYFFIVQITEFITWELVMMVFRYCSLHFTGCNWETRKPLKQEVVHPNWSVFSGLLSLSVYQS